MIKERIQEDLKKALKSREELKVSTLRMLLSSIHNKEIEKRQELTQEEIQSVISKEIKKRKEAILEYKKGRREDLVEKEQRELQFLESYLPKQLSEEELQEIITKVIKEVGGRGASDFGRVMSQIMPQVKGRAEGSTVAQIVKKMLE